MNTYTHSGVTALILLALFTGAAETVRATPSIEQAMQAVRLRDYASAVEILRPLADAGDAEAQYRLASFYRSGKGVERDYKLAFQWFSRAAAQNHAKAEFNLGKLYENGWGVATDSRQAEHWYARAAAHNHAMARARIEPTADGSTESTAVLTLEEANRQLRWASQKGETRQISSALQQQAEIDHIDRYGRTALIDAVDHGHLQATRLLLDSGATPGIHDRNGDSALLIAARRANSGLVRLLLESGGNANDRDRHGNTVLIIATANKCEQCIPVLMGSGADIHATNKKGLTALNLARINGHTPSIQALKAAGAREYVAVASDSGSKKSTPDLKTLRSATVAKNNAGATPFSGWSAAMIAAWRGNLEAVTRLVENQPDAIRQKDEHGFSLLSRAAAQGHTATVRYLVSKGAIIDEANNAGNTSLLLAVDGGHTDTVKALLQAGASIEHANNNGHNPLILALIRKQKRIAGQLLESGANVEHKSRDGRNALILATSLSDPGLLTLILEKRPQINATDANGRTALWHAANSGWKPGVEKLVSAGANADIADHQGITPLSTTVFMNHPQIFGYLLDRGASTRLSVKATGDNLLMVIAASGNLKLARRIIGKLGKPEINRRNRQGNTALMQAIIENHPTMVDLLLSHGANPDLRNRKRENARDLAEQQSRTEIVALIDTRFPFSKLMGKLY